MSQASRLRQLEKIRAQCVANWERQRPGVALWMENHATTPSTNCFGAGTPAYTRWLTRCGWTPERIVALDARGQTCLTGTPEEHLVQQEELWARGEVVVYPEPEADSPPLD